MDKLEIKQGSFYTTNPVFYTSGNRFVRRTGMFGNLIFSLTRHFHIPRSALRGRGTKISSRVQVTETCIFVPQGLC
jgi:hypothetical protein